MIWNRLFIAALAFLAIHCASAPPKPVAGTTRPGHCAMRNGSTVDCFDDAGQCLAKTEVAKGSQCVPVQAMSCLSYRSTGFEQPLEQCYATHDECIESQSVALPGRLLVNGCDGLPVDAKITPNTCVLDSYEKPLSCTAYGMDKCNRYAGKGNHCRTFSKLECFSYRSTGPEEVDQCWPTHDDCVEHQQQMSGATLTVTSGCGGGPVRVAPMKGGACSFDDMMNLGTGTCMYRDVATCEQKLAEAHMSGGNRCRPVETFHCYTLLLGQNPDPQRYCSSTLDECFDHQAMMSGGKDIQIEVGCDGTSPQAALPTPAMRPAKECLTGPKGSICGPTPSMCEMFRKGFPGECKHYDKVTCYALKGPAPTRRLDQCFPTAAECSRKYQTAKGLAGTELLADCQPSP